MKPNKKDKITKKFSSIKEHKRIGKQLIPPLGNFNIKPIQWDKDLLPEFLWIDALTQKFGSDVVHDKFYQFLDTIESYIEEKEFYLIGFISDFRKVNQDIREEILRKEESLIKELFIKPIGNILSLYPKCPASWLIPEEWLIDSKIAKDDILNSLKEVLIRLYKAKDEYCAHIRVLPLGRLLKHGKLRFSADIEEIKLLPKYPKYLNDEEKKICQSIARTITNTVIQFEIMNEERNFEWSKHFWNQNFDLTTCKYPSSIDFIDEDKEFKKKIDQLLIACEKNVKILEKYLFIDLIKMKKNLYDPSKDEVIIGLFSRAIRIYTVLLNNPQLWAIDMSNILLRCLTDTIFILCYLLKQNDDKLFQKFIDYGRGKEKLLLLHLQDNYHSEITTGVEDIEKLEIELGGPFFVEFLNVNFGNWIDKSARDMAFDCGFEMEYRLIYNPTSEDVHGSWFSIRKANLIRCINPLHRFHRLPQKSPPPIFLNPLFLANELVEKMIQYCIKYYNFPDFKETLSDFREFLDIFKDFK